MKRNPVFIILGTLVGLNILALVAVWELGGNGGLEVTFFDVGQGDSIFIETPQRHQILIDGGPNDTIIKKLGKEMPFWDRTLDLIILTHPEHDHLAGLLEVLKQYKVEDILWTGVLRDTVEFQEWQRLIKEEGAQIYIAQAGEKLSFSEKLSFLSILYPFESLDGKKVENSNDTSIIPRLVFGKTSFLFTGDISKFLERQLLSLVKQFNSDVLKVSHHGSKTSSSKEFIEAVSPGVAVISVGRNNSYGHPHPETLTNLAGVKILRTDSDGDIKIISDGTAYQIK